MFISWPLKFKYLPHHQGLAIKATNLVELRLSNNKEQFSWEPNFSFFTNQTWDRQEKAKSYMQIGSCSCVTLRDCIIASCIDMSCQLNLKPEGSYNH